MDCYIEKKELISIIINKIGQIATQKKTQEDIVATELGMSRSNFFALKKYVTKENIDEPSFSYQKLLAISERLSINVKGVYFKIEKSLKILD